MTSMVSAADTPDQMHNLPVPPGVVPLESVGCGWRRMIVGAASAANTRQAAMGESVRG